MKRLLCIMLAAVLVMSMAISCGKKEMTDADYEELIRSNADTNRKTVIMTVAGPNGDVDITKDQMLYYLAYYEKQGLEYKKENSAYFQSMYGEDYDFWKTPATDGTAMSKTYKDAAFSSMVFTLIMYEDAVAAGEQLVEKRVNSIDKLTKNFLNGYTLEERARCGMDEESIRKCYEKILLADQHKETLTAGVKVDEEAIRATVNKELFRVYETDYLYVAYRSYDSDFQAVELSEEELNARKNAIWDVYEKAKAGDTMKTLQESYSDKMTYATRDFYSSDASIEKEYITTAEGMKPGDVTMLETSGGCYVIKLIDNTKYVGYEEAMAKAVESEKEKNIAEAYKAIEERYKVTTVDAYDAITMGKIYSK